MSVPIQTRDFHFELSVLRDLNKKYTTRTNKTRICIEPDCCQFAKMILLSLFSSLALCIHRKLFV